MASEIERKFLFNIYDLELQSILKNSKNYLIQQGYLDLKKDSAIQVKLFENEKDGFFLITSKNYHYQKKISKQDYQKILQMCENNNYYTNEHQIFRIRQKNEQAFLTLKGKKIGISQPEYEYEIPVKEAQKLFQFCPQMIEKNRVEIFLNNKKWELDFFKGKNEGLIVAEIELNNENEEIILPKWIIQEVSYDRKFSNANLSQYPFSSWTEEEAKDVHKILINLVKPNMRI
jgi:adenylate cyclase